MARRRSSSTADDIIEIGARLPWWLSLALAFVSYLLLHRLSLVEIPEATTVSGIGKAAGNQLIQTVSSFAQYLVPSLLCIGALVALVKGAKRKSLVRQVSGTNAIRKVDDLSWEQFEQLVFQVFKQAGFQVQDTRPGPDGGIDLRLTKAGERATVQCKHWPKKKVGVQIVREQFGVQSAESADLGIVVTSGYFTDEARKFASGLPMRLIDGAELQSMLSMVSEDITTRTTPPANGANDPSCPNCGGSMVVRTARRGTNAGSEFWGCESFPKCRGTRSA